MSDSKKNSSFDLIHVLELLWLIGGISAARFAEVNWGWTGYEAALGVLALGLGSAFLIGFMIFAWRSAIRPSGSLLRDEGIVGLGRFLYGKFFYALLYGRRGKQP
jgi:hypothetical protein